ncbi:MAG: hypothetical protein R3E82_15390 [Pseudomonadales bacterium]|nr:hypothetical protein [Pseudomonadales bacterium]
MSTLQTGIRLLSAAVLLSSTVQAADFIILEDECNGQQMLIRGSIEPGDADRFSARFAGFVNSNSLPLVQNQELLWTLKLDSPGGDLQEAMAIGRRVRELLVTTEVNYRFVQRPDGVYDFDRKSDAVCLSGDDRLAGCSPSVAVAECTGACLLIWLAGADRRAIEGRLGNHGLASGSSQAADYLSDMEIDPIWISRLLEVEADREINTAAGAPRSDGWLDWTGKGELSGRTPALDTLLADCPAPLSAAQAIESVMTSSPGHRASLLDRNEAYWNCRNTRVGEVRAGVNQLPMVTAQHDSRTIHPESASSHPEIP